MISKRLLVYSVLIVLICLSYLLLFNKERFSIVPLQSDIAFGTYHEGTDSVHSYSSVNKVKGNVVLNYRLAEGIQEPFSAAYFYKTDSPRSFFDFSNFDAVRLKIKSINAKRIPVTFTLNQEGFTDWNKELSNMPFTYLLDLTESGEYEISIKDFEIPSWWLRLHHLKKDDFKSIDLSRVNYFVIGSCQLLDSNIDDKIEIEEIRLFHSNDKLRLVLLIFVGTLLIVIGGIELSRRRKKIIVPVFGGEIEEQTSNSDELAVLINFFAKNYSRENLSQEEVANETQIKSRRIGELLKDQLGTNFKNYLNVVRIAEVKRLLKETDLTISEIAYKAGYNHISHFNRVFKNEVGCSPKQFRSRK